MNDENKTDTIYLRKGVGNKTYCVTCQKLDSGYSVLFEKKIKIRSKNKVCDVSKSTSRKPVFSSLINVANLDSIDYSVIMSSLVNEEKEMFRQIVEKLEEGLKNG